ncbi:TIR domain-containing protein [Marinomonas lutimaris]|uniref:TIR domain-containing protein n=1 Tax=Marinomonas lutimaris TaxID=2846746 RepID=UPI001C66E1E4|nr:TIR domain-containing protein [Marinomonas lutimaris]
MKIFISWSGNRSKAVAELMSDWLKCVIQASQPWISTRDIDRGAIWFTEINDKLKDVSVGVVCLTQENKDKPWILFETGALAKGLTTNRVCTLLVDLKPEDLQDPLGQFNHTTVDKSSVWALTRTINSCLDSNALEERILEQVFETYWPAFNDGFEKAIRDNPPQENIPPRSEQDILSEILNHTRGLSNRIRKLESNVKFDSFDNAHYFKIHDDDINKRVSEMIYSGEYGLGSVSNYLNSLGFGNEEKDRIINEVMESEKLNIKGFKIKDTKNTKGR